MASNKLTINNLRPEKGGDPDKYRNALKPSSAELVDQAIQYDTERRTAQTSLEQLRHQVSDLQTHVIAPKKKAGEEVPTETVGQLKQWKSDINRLSDEVKEWEKKRKEVLAKMNDLLAGVDLYESTSITKDSPAAPTNDASNNCEKEDTSTHANMNGVQILKRLESTEAAAIRHQSSAEPSLPLLSPEQIKTIPPERILNLNVGVLGHVDTGKTSLVKTLSSVLSTAALDKSKQSRARGITLDLGFSAFLLPLPDHLKNETIGDDVNSSSGSSSENSSKPQIQKSELQQKYDLLQVTLVDCPGHASLIRTIIGGAQIIDMVLLVVDATKGMQTQTAECLVIAEMTTRNLIVVLNKVDLFPEDEREERIRIAEKKMRAALRGTKFENAIMVGISACVGGEKVAAIGGLSGESSHLAGTQNIHGLLEILQSHMRAPNRDVKPSSDRFHFAVDHCFPIKGQGTVLTGTCLSGTDLFLYAVTLHAEMYSWITFFSHALFAGSARPNDMIEFPTLATQKKIKGLQMFRRKANVVQQGDRAGICVSNFDAKLMERGEYSSIFGAHSLV
jgi:translation elongation factor EF-Tu-like GTPase